MQLHQDKFVRQPKAAQFPMAHAYTIAAYAGFVLLVTPTVALIALLLFPLLTCFQAMRKIIAMLLNPQLWGT